MRRFSSLLIAGIVLAAVTAGLSGGATRSEARWVVTDLGTLGKDHWGSYATAINDRGQVVGTSLNHEAMFVYGGRGFLWEKGRMRDLGALRGMRYSQAWGINESGQIAGSSFSIDEDNGRLFRSRATVWVGRRMQALTGDDRYKGNDYQSEAMAINDRGDVAGWDYYGALLWQDGEMRRLVESGLATAINGRGQVVGILGGADSNGRWGPLSGFVWQDGHMRDLGKLGGYGWRDGHTNWICEINDKGQIVGGRNGHATIWVGNAPRRLREVQGAPRQQSWANAINERGQIVGGWRRTPRGDVRAALWQRGSLTLLPGLPSGGNRAEAYGVNDAGQIVGQADTGKHTHAVLWTLK